MAKPYQDLQGNWFIAGRPMTLLDIEAGRAGTPVLPQPTMVKEVTIKIATKKPATRPSTVKDTSRVRLSPLGAAFSRLFK